MGVGPLGGRGSDRVRDEKEVKAGTMVLRLSLRRLARGGRSGGEVDQGPGRGATGTKREILCEGLRVMENGCA